MFGFKRGDRVQHVHEAYSPLSGKQGTVTRFRGDPGIARMAQWCGLNLIMMVKEDGSR